MRQALAAMLVVCAVALSAAGDRVRLKDGRVIEGKVRRVEGKVLVELTYGVVSFPASQVESIEHMPTPAEVVEWRLTQIERSDADALFEIAQWAADNDLPRRAEELLREVLELKADHARARKLLGYIKADGKWISVAEALELADGKLAAGRYDMLLSLLLPALREAVATPADRLRVDAVEARCRLRSKQFAPAAKAFAKLAETAPLPDSTRYAAIAGILQAHPDGMYVVTEAASVELAGPGAPAVENGPASLADPDVLASALRDKAKAAIDEARGHMAEARKLESSEPDSAAGKYALAARRLDEADGIVTNIARGFRVEIARRRILMISGHIKTQAEVFDQLKAKLGNVSPVAYENHLTRMLRALGHIRGDLEAILEIAAPFHNDLILEVTDAKGQLQRIKAVREILIKERDELKRDATR